MSGLTDFKVGYSNTFGGDLSFLDISYILTPRTSGTNVTNTNMFYKQSGNVYTDISNIFLKSSTNGATGISYEVISVTNFYDPSSNNYADIGSLFQPYYNDISFSSITSSNTGLIIYKYINGVKIVNNGNSNFAGSFIINPGQTGVKSVKFACVGAGSGGAFAGGGGGGGIIIGSVDMSNNQSYNFGVGNGGANAGGATFFRVGGAGNTTFNFNAGGGLNILSTDISGNGFGGGSVSVKLSSGFNCTLNYISSGGGGGGGYFSTSGYYGKGGDGGTYSVTGTPTIDISGIGQKGFDASNNPFNYGGTGGGNFSSTYTSFNSIPDQTVYYFGGGGGGGYNGTGTSGYNGYPSGYPTNTWITGGLGGSSTNSTSTTSTSYQFGGGGAGTKTPTGLGSGGPGALMFSWNYT